MEYRTLTIQKMYDFAHNLRETERSPATKMKYLRDIRKFYLWLPEDKRVNKDRVMEYKQELVQKYAVSSVNAMLSAVNGLLMFLGWQECRVKALKRQRRIFLRQERELNRMEYMRLLEAARCRKNQRLYLLMQTICATGIRVSELSEVTVEAVKAGRAEIACKGKVRTVFLPRKLCENLKNYLKKNRIQNGPVFQTKSGKPLDRSNIWSEMKKLCESAGVSATKVFPHNLRHLFARTFYSREKDIARLADLLGHSSIETTRIYTMSSGAEHARKIEALGLLWPA